VSLPWAVIRRNPACESVVGISSADIEERVAAFGCEHLATTPWTVAYWLICAAASFAWMIIVVGAIALEMNSPAETIRAATREAGGSRERTIPDPLFECLQL
jgi:hypothetical protein